jgi:hypothetical protein
MGIYKVKSNICDCMGQWCTLTADHSIYITKYCSRHELVVDNIIYYELIHVLKHITNNLSSNIYKIKYPIKILHIDCINIRNKLIKLELKHDNTINVNQFDTNKQIYYSQLNDEPLWSKIDDNTIHFNILYNSRHHTIEGLWEPYDY